METEAGVVTVIGTLLVTNNCRQLARRQGGEPRGQHSESKGTQDVQDDTQSPRQWHTAKGK